MPVFYNFTENGLVYSFDDVFVPADLFREGGLWTWGANSSGRLGNFATTGNTSTPVTTFSGGTDWKQVSAANFHTAAIKTNGTLWTWGNTALGRLGNAFGTGDTTVNRCTPVTTFAGGTDWKQASVNTNQTAAIKTDGTLWLWGSNSYGQLGDNTTTNRSIPVTTFVGGNNWKQVGGGGVHAAAIKTNGTLWTWGRNDDGQLGINLSGATTGRTTPVTTFAGGTNWKQVDCGGGNHTVAIKTDGTLWTWGRNGYGQLGDNTTINRSTPVTTFAGGTNWKQVAASVGSNTAAVTSGTDPTYFIS
jgi:alpha-tubulin suppressor-like RCC1 family protein